jgi:hypothetical protein
MRNHWQRVRIKGKYCVIFSTLFFIGIYYALRIRDHYSNKTTSAQVISPLSKGLTRGIDPSTRSSIEQSFGKLPLSFEVNNGQADKSVNFLSRGRGYTVLLNSTEAVLNIQHGARKKKKHLLKNPAEDVIKEESESAEVIRLKSIGSNPNPKITGMDELGGKSNYFIGNDSSKWHTNISTYAKVKVEEVYPGIDLVYYGNQRQLEYDWIVAPGADPKNIRFEVTGKEDLSIDNLGNLILDKRNNLLLRKPVIYQQNDGKITEIAGQFLLLGKHLVGIQLGKYNPSFALIVDPILSYSTFLGGRGIDEAWSIALDSSDNVYITGDTASDSFPVVNPFQANLIGGNTDAIVLKFSPSRNEIIYSTYLGGNFYDYGYDIAVDSYGNAYVTGSTEAPNFPIFHAFQSSIGSFETEDGFVTKLSAAGNELIFSTYLGGDKEDAGISIAIDSLGNSYIAGATYSRNFPTANAFQSTNNGQENAFVTKFTTDGDLVYSTFLGGEFLDSAYGIAVDSSENAYVTGATYSDNFPTENPLQRDNAGATDAFITKLNASGNSLIYSTFFGGSKDDYGRAIAVDSLNQAYVGGVTYSDDFPTKDAAQVNYGGGTKDAFVLKLSAGGDTLIYSTYLGGSQDDQCWGLAVDSFGYSYVTGFTDSTDFPIKNSIFTNVPTVTNAFVSKLDLSGNSLLYSTFLGGDISDYGTSITVNSHGEAYVTGVTSSENFPVVNAYQEENMDRQGSSQDLFIAKISTDDIAAVPVVTTAVIASMTQTTASGGGNVTADNGASITARGVCWSTSANPTIANICSSDGTGTGTFTSSIVGLTIGTTYHIRAYATNTVGTAYGTEKVFTTLTLPAVTTAGLSSITQTSAIVGGNVVSDDTVPVTSRGVCWSISWNPTTSDTCTSDGTGPGAFTSSIVGLTADTVYNYRAYAVSSIGTAYGMGRNFATLAPPDFRIYGGSRKEVNAGSSAVYNLSITGVSNFSGTVTFTYSGLPKAAICSIPSPLNISGSAVFPFNVTIGTTASSTTTGMIEGPYRFPWNYSESVLFMGLAGLPLMVFAQKRRRLSIAFLLLSTVGLAGCGSGSSSRTTPSKTPPSKTTTIEGTPAGTYTITLTATSGSISHNINLTLTVN